jgi:NAD(P)-dependent dehydrogenase (short-subunit alcohol dehydrogenase family)
MGLDHQKGQKTKGIIFLCCGVSLQQNAQATESIIRKEPSRRTRIDNKSSPIEVRMTGQLEGKAALVTGGSSRIGRATALAFSKEGTEIVNTTSAYGLVGGGNREMGLSAYVASKHSVVGQTKATALEYGEASIRVNAVCPGHIRTPLIVPDTGFDPEVEKQLNARYSVERVGEPEEVDKVVVRLCSDSASHVTGHALSVGGGFVG